MKKDSASVSSRPLRGHAAQLSRASNPLMLVQVAQESTAETMSPSLSSLPPSDSLVAVGIQRFEASMLALLAPAEPVNPVPSRAKRRPKKAGSSSTPPELPELEREGEPEAASAAQRGVADVAATADSTAAESFFGQLGAGTPLDAQRLAALQRRVTVDVLRSAVLGLATEREGFAKWRLFDDRICGVEERSLATDWRKLEPLRVASAGPEELGELLESLLALAAHEKRGKLHFAPSQQRKQKGMFYTPRGVVDSVVKTAIAPWLEPGRPLPRVCDPSMGGGAFLLGVARELARAQGVSIADDQLRRAIVVHFSGFDIEPLAIAIAEAALLLWSRGGDEEAAELNRQLRITDALEVHDECAYDLVIGNPPWVAYAGRATQPLSEQRRAWLAKSFEAFRGYPTMQACFVELAARLAPAGRIALLVPSPIADLDGYRPMRCVLTRTHRVDAELVEYGQDAFEGVVQPCFGLIADADAASRESEAPFVLAERSGLDAAAERVEVPECLVQLERLDRFPGDCFKEYGFQTAAEVTREMLLRADAPSPPFEYPLLEGKDVSEFTVGAPRVFLNADRERLRALSCRLREAEEYRQVELVVRQTAKYTIAALHSGLPFRNSLLAGFGNTQFSAAVLVGLLNSTLMRSVHMAARRDARQRTFPQVKVAHLRALPAPPTDAQRAREMELLVRSIGNAKPSLAQREQLDALVYGWYGIASRDAVVIDRFFDKRGR